MLIVDIVDEFSWRRTCHGPALYMARFAEYHPLLAKEALILTVTTKHVCSNGADQDQARTVDYAARCIFPPVYLSSLMHE